MMCVAQMIYVKSISLPTKIKSDWYVCMWFVSSRNSNKNSTQFTTNGCALCIWLLILKTFNEKIRLNC